MIFIKKRWAAALCAVLMAGLTACGGNVVNSEPFSESPTNPPAPNVVTGAQILDYNPLTGEALETGVQQGQRPVAVMINNAGSALPQRGIAAADAVFEMVTEGGITRLMALYSDYTTMPQVGPVRSARDQHLQFALPLNAIIVHIGSSTYARNLLNEYQYQDIDGVYLGTVSFWFDAERAKTRLNEHCWYTDSTLVAAGIANRQITTTGAGHPLFDFAAVGTTVTPADGDAPNVSLQFSDSVQVGFVYDATAKQYLKSYNGEPHVDETTGAQLGFTNVVLLGADIGLKEDNYCTDFDLSGGKGYYLSGGTYEAITWEKSDVASPLVLYDANGKELAVNVGKSYVGVLGKSQLDAVVMDVNAPQPSAEPGAASTASTAQAG